MRYVLLLLFIPLVSCTVPQVRPSTLSPVSFSELEGWKNDTLVDALAAFQRSCGEKKNTSTEWQSVCQEALRTPLVEDSARSYFEQWFQPYALIGKDGKDGLFTGYYVPEMNGSLEQGGTFQTPLYEKPSDLISGDLGAFKSDLKGQHIVGKVSGTQFIPYDARAAIVRGSLEGRSHPIVWLDDPVGAFFLEIQGSGRVHLADGSLLSVGYDGTNGRAYRAIGRVLADQGDLERPVTMPAIRAWLESHPERAQEIMNINASYVFFKRQSTGDIFGAEGVPLTPMRSLAVDPTFIHLGTPVWLATTDSQNAPLQRLMIAQDTGGAIKGAVRGDVFWGTGDAASRQAGAMQSRGCYFVLLPKSYLVSPASDNPSFTDSSAP